jgi:hypothetical protein
MRLPLFAAAIAALLPLGAAPALAAPAPRVPGQLCRAAPAAAPAL